MKNQLTKLSDVSKVLDLDNFYVVTLWNDELQLQARIVNMPNILTDMDKHGTCEYVVKNKTGGMIGVSATIDGISVNITLST